MRTGGARVEDGKEKEHRKTKTRVSKNGTAGMTQKYENLTVRQK